MSQLSKLLSALATTSAVVLSVSGAHAAGINIPKPTIHIFKPTIHIPKPTVHIAIPKPVVPAVTIPKLAAPAIRPAVVTPTPVRPALVAQPVTVKGTPSTWQGPAGAGKQATSMIYLNGKPVGATSAIAITAPKPTTASAVPASMKPIVPGTVPIAKPPASSTPAPVAAKPAAPAPAAAPAKPKVTFTPVKYPAFKDQNGTVKGYYVNGKPVMGMTGPSGGNCSVTTAYQVLGGGGGLSSNHTPGSTLVTAVQCYTKS